VEPGERAEVEAWRSLYGAIEERGIGRRLEIAGGVCGCFDALPDVLMTSRAVGIGVESPVSAGDLEEIDAFFREAGTRYQVAVSPAAEDLAELLAERGLEPAYPWAIFRRDAGPYKAPTELRVEGVGADRADQCGRVIVRAYEMPEAAADALAAVIGRPGWHAFMTYDGDEPVGGATVFVHERAAWLGGAGTLPAHRRKGSQGALLAARIRKAAEQGAEVLATETGALENGRPANSYRNLVRVGFEEIYVRPNYAPPE
jgi:GNAT superfamily N-acetyltransferase